MLDAISEVLLLSLAGSLVQALVSNTMLAAAKMFFDNIRKVVLSFYSGFGRTLLNLSIKAQKAKERLKRSLWCKRSIA
jgi:1,4-dihydroxy-2-naphthoyl-CoA synthase